jgi:hypothetical protein
MPEIFDPQEIEILRGLAPRQAFERVKSRLYADGRAGSDEFLDAFDELVSLQILTPEQLEEFLG